MAEVQVLVIDSYDYKPTECTVASDDSSFVGLIKAFLTVVATERITNNQNVLLYISQCTTVEQLYDICNAFIAPLVKIKWYILTTTY
jgi:hypothetical protein